MPKIQWTNLPPSLRQHLFDRLEERKITVADLYQLKLWRESDPEAPEGLWYKDFGTLKSAAKASYPKRSFKKPKHPKASLSNLCVLCALCGEIPALTCFTP